MPSDDPNKLVEEGKKKVITAGKVLLESLQNDEKVLDIIVIVIIFTLILAIGIWISNKLSLKEKNCDNYKKLYTTSDVSLKSITAEDNQHGGDLRDYFIKTAYNCCCGGDFKNDFVSLCALEQVLKQGARCLDFEIYSVGGEPVIAASSVLDYTVKETYNSLAFSDVIQTIANNAFNAGTVMNSNDPLILHFRIKSAQADIYGKMAKDIYNILESKNLLLDKKYSFEFKGPDGYQQNLGAEPLLNFLGKIIICVNHDQHAIFESTPLNEYINITSNSVFLRQLRDTEVVYSHDPDELITHNKKNMSIVLPDLSPDNNNENALLCMSGYGCQMAAMSFQNFDANMEVYSAFFDGVGSAFVLKPEPLRFIPKYVNVPPVPPKSQCAAPRSRPVPGGFTITT